MGRSDLNLVHLNPLFASGEKAAHKNEDSEEMAEAVYETLEGCCEVTALQAVYETHMEDIDGHMKSITDYISFCHFTVLAETAHCYPNNKPKVTNNINAILNAKKRAFRANNREEVRIIQGEMKVKIREVQERYRRKLKCKL